MSDDERIEQLELEVKVLLSNNKGLKDKIEELKREKAIYYYEWRHLEANVINKIQEYDDKGMTVNLTNRSAGKTFQQAVHYEVKKALQSLLEKDFPTTITKEELEKIWKE